MNKIWLKDRNTQIVIACILALILAYSVDAFHLAYRLAAWETFGDTSVRPAKLQYFIADTPDVIGYTEKDTGERVDCAEAVAYLETGAGETYRCCQAQTRVSCVAGDFSSDIPLIDTTCTDSLISTFGAPLTLPDTKDYLVYGVCSDSGNSELTVAQIDAADQIRWKTATIFGPSMVNNGLRCLLGPAALILLIRTVIMMRRNTDPDKQIRKW